MLVPGQPVEQHVLGPECRVVVALGAVCHLVESLDEDLEPFEAGR